MAGAKVVLVTGSSDGGIGAAMCTAFQEAGCRVFASARRLESMKGLEAIGCELVQLDVCDQASVQKCVDQVVAKAGRIDILVRN
jgi:1-acylglycerone phosphate reductase